MVRNYTCKYVSEKPDGNSEANIGLGILRANLVRVNPINPGTMSLYAL